MAFARNLCRGVESGQRKRFESRFAAYASRESPLSLFDEFERYGSGVAFVQRRGYRRETWTYRELAGVAVTCALELKERGVRTGDRVLLWGPNSAEWTAAFWGCLLRGAVAVPMDDGATLDFAGRVAQRRGRWIRFSLRARRPLRSIPPSRELVLENLADTARSCANVRGLAARD